MNLLRGIIYGESKNLTKRIYISNLCSSMIYSVQSAILLLIVTRVAGVYVAGVFSITYTVTQTLASLGSYSMRNFQVSDAKNKYTFKEYYFSRVFTCIIMMFACLVYCIYNGYNLEESSLVLIFGGYRFIDGIEDVFHGQVQKDGRLDACSIAVFLRILISILAFCITLIVTRNLLFSSGCLLLISVILFLVFNQIVFDKNILIKATVSFKNIINLLFSCFPVFFGAIMYNYLVNIPKYAIDRNMDKESQTIFNVIFMPIFVINVLSTFIFKPMIVDMSVWWEEEDVKKLAKSIFRQSIIIFILTTIVAIAGYLVGCPILAFVYGIDLSGFRNLFFLLLIFGGVSALGTFFSVVLTVMRRQIFIIAGYVFAFILQLFFVDKMVKDYGIYGAGYCYGLIMACATLVFLIFIILCLFCKNNLKRGTVDA